MSDILKFEKQLPLSEAVGDPVPGMQWVKPFDVAATFNMRGWLRKAVEAQGARMTGGSVGPDDADIDIELDGCKFNICIRAL